MSSDSNNDDGMEHDEIPVLTEVAGGESEQPVKQSFEVVGPESLQLDEDRLGELEAELVARTHDLADQLIHTAFEQMEAAIFEQVSNRLRSELPDLIDKLLRDYLRTP